MRAIGFVVGLLVATSSVAAATVQLVDENQIRRPGIGDADALLVGKIYFTPGYGGVVYPALARLRTWAATHPKRLRLEFAPLAPSPDRRSLAKLCWVAARADKLETLLIKSPSFAARDEDLLTVATSVGIDRETAAAALTSSALAEQVAADQAEFLRTVSIPSNNYAVLILGGETIALNGDLSIANLDRIFFAVQRTAKEKLERGASKTQLKQALQEDPASEALPMPRALSKPDSLFTGFTALNRRQTRFGELVDPLQLTGLPSLGNRAGNATVVVACDLAQPSCGDQVEMAAKVATTYGLRMVWAPLFNPAWAHSATVADATLCAEELGVGVDWLVQIARLSRAGRLRESRNRDAPEKSRDNELDAITRSVGADRGRFSYCRAVRAGAASKVAQELIARGLTHAPVILVGWRAFPPISARDLDALIRQEFQTGWLSSLAPAWLSSTMDE